MEKYIINKEIGSGSFGKVFAVESKTTGIHYVAKQIDLSKLDSRRKKASEREVQVLSKLKHPNIVRYKEAYTDDMNLYIIMELCDMGDLHSIIQNTRQKNELISESQTVQYFVQICLALNYIHHQRILHRDLKTKNIFLKRGDVVKLGDFGVAKVLENSFELAQTCIGSPFYISPEICNNQPYDKKSDVWALGCVLFEITTLKYAFTASNMKTLINKITSGDHAPLPANTSPRIRHLIKKLLTMDPKQRPTVNTILSWPYLSVAVDKLPCKLREVGLNREENVKQSFASITSAKPMKSLLSGSRSCTNLCSSSITEPETKYKPTTTKPRTGKSSILNNKATAAESPRNIGLEISKCKKLPRSDSLYYSLFTDNKTKLENPVALVRNVFVKSNGNNGNKKDVNIDSKELNSDIFTLEDKQVEDADDQDEKLTGHYAGSNIRKKWAVNTSDKIQLVSILNDVDLENTFEGVSSTPQTIDQLLFLNTSDLSHIPVLQPLKIHYQSDAEGGNAEFEINDTTYNVLPSTSSTYEQLEKRKVILEQKIGLCKFLDIYKHIERFWCDETTGNIMEAENIEEVAKILNTTEQTLQEVWQLVKDDFLFR